MAHFRDMLHEKQQRATPARLAILELLERAKRPLSVHGIIRGLGRDSMDYTTVYRTVTLLKNIGLIRQIDFHHNHAHFELALLGDHHHVVCKKCHTIVDVPHCNVRRMEKEALEESGFDAITEHTLEFFGVCRACAV